MKPTLSLLLVLLPASVFLGCNSGQLKVDSGDLVVKYDVDGMT